MKFLLTLFFNSLFYAVSAQQICVELMPIFAQFETDTIDILEQPEIKDFRVIKQGTPSVYRFEKVKTIDLPAHWEAQKKNGVWCKVWVETTYKIIAKPVLVSAAIAPVVEEIIVQPAIYKKVTQTRIVRQGDVLTINKKCD